MKPAYRRAALAVTVALGMLSVVPGVAFAANPACGTTIMNSVTLSGDLDCSLWAGDAITFGKKNLTLNLNGHTIWGPAGDDSYSGVATYYKKNVTVKNGTISGFDINVYADHTVNGTFKHLTLQGDASLLDTGIYIQGGAGNTVDHVTVDDTNNGVDVEFSAGNWLTNNTVTDTLSSSFYLYLEQGDHLSGNHVTNYGDEAFYEFESGNDTYTNNQTDAGTGGGHFGFNFECDEYGSVTLRNNTATGNSDYGFYLFECYDDNSLDSFQASVVAGNVSNDNSGDGFYDYFSLQVKYMNNTAKRNGGYGLYLDYPGGYTVTGNVASNNGSDGIYMTDMGYGAYGNPKVVSNNTANGNGGYGIYADYGVANASGNHAHNNSTAPDDCWNIDCN